MSVLLLEPNMAVLGLTAVVGFEAADWDDLQLLDWLLHLGFKLVDFLLKDLIGLLQVDDVLVLRLHHPNLRGKF